MQDSNDTCNLTINRRKIDVQRIKTLDSFTREQCGRDNWTSGLRFCVRRAPKIDVTEIHRFQFPK